MADKTKVVSEISKIVKPFTGTKGWPCKAWVFNFAHQCETFKLSEALRKQVFAACMQGDALRWYTSLQEEDKEDLDDIIDLLFERFVPPIAFQAELERVYQDLQQTQGQSVSELGRDHQLLISEMTETPSLAKQLKNFKRSLIPSIKSKLEIRTYADLNDMIEQAKLVEADFINQSSSEYSEGLTKGMLQPVNTSALLLGIHEADDVKEILTLGNNKPSYIPKESNIELKTLLEAITRIQHTVDNLQQKQASQNSDQFPYPGRGNFFGATSPQGKLARQQRRKDKVNQRNQQQPQPSFKRDDDFQRRRHSQESYLQDNTKRSSDEPYCAFHDSTTHTDYECRAQKRLKYHNNQILTVTEEEQDRAKDEELKATPLKLIGCANSLNEPIGVVGDSGSAVCLVALSQVLRTKLKILAANRTKINKGIGNLCIVKSQGLT